MVINVVCNLTDAQVAVLNKKLANAMAEYNETLEQLFQRYFWDGYEGDTGFQDGVIWSQIRQWMKEQIEADNSSNSVLTKG